MRINVKKFKQGRRPINVELRFDENGELNTDSFKFYYDQLSSRRSRELDSMFEDLTKEEIEALDADERLRYERALAEGLASFNLTSPDIVDDDGKEVPLSVDELDEWELRNLIAIRDAIRSDANPNA